MSVRNLLSVSLLASLSLGCASLVCPAKGGAPWTELTSAHMVLRTDADPAEARALLVEYEALHAVLAQLAQRPPAQADTRVELVRFERRRDFYEIAGHNPTLGGASFHRFAPGDVEPQPTMVTYAGDVSDEAREMFLHLLSYRFLYERFAAVPTWLNEGFAGYFETLRIEDGRIVLGAVGRRDFSDRPYPWISRRGSSYTTQIPVRTAPTVATLVSADWATFYAHQGSEDPTNPTNENQERESANRAAAWKLVHYFLNGPDEGDRARFTKLLTAMQHGARGRDAFQALFGGDMPRLEEAFHRYLKEERLPRRVADYRRDPAPAQVIQRPMSDAEVHLLWARLLPWNEGSMDLVRHQLHEALVEDPRSPEVRYRRAIFLLRQGQLDGADGELAAALAAHPDEPRYLLVGLLLLDRRAKLRPGSADQRVEEDIVERLARTAVSPAELNAAAAHKQAYGQNAEGFRLVDRALAADPLCWECLRTRAKLLADVGKADEAYAAIERAISLLPERASARELVALRRTIELDASRARAGSGAVLVGTVLPGGQATKAGIAPGDILLRYNADRLDSIDTLLRLVNNTPASESVTLQVLRGAQKLTFKVHGGLLDITPVDLSPDPAARPAAHP